jgi:hypothetical protein
VFSPAEVVATTACPFVSFAETGDIEPMVAPPMYRDGSKPEGTTNYIIDIKYNNVRIPCVAGSSASLPERLIG